MTAHHKDTVEQFRLNKCRVTRDTITSVTTKYYSIRPGYHTTIMINKDGSTATLKMTNGFTKSGPVIGTVDDEEFGEEQSSGTDDYHKGHTAGFTGCEIDCTVSGNDIEVVITEFLLGR